MTLFKPAVALIIIAIAALIVSKPVEAKVSIFTDHQVVHMLRHRVYNPYAPTGDLPYLGRVGLEYEARKLTYSISYIHRSNADITGIPEYNYDGISAGIKFTHCIAMC